MSERVKEIVKTLGEEKGFKKIIQLSIKSERLQELNPYINKLCNLEELDIQSNFIKSLSGILLPQLKVLKCQNNLLSTFDLNGFKSLEQIYIIGNPIHVQTTEYFIVDQFPQLKFIDNVSTETIKSNTKKIEQVVKSKLEPFWLQHFHATTFNDLEDEASIKSILEKLEESLKELSPQLPSIPRKFKNSKYFTLTKNFLEIKKKHLRLNRNAKVKNTGSPLKKLTDGFHTPTKLSTPEKDVRIATFKSENRSSAKKQLTPSKIRILTNRNRQFDNSIGSVKRKLVDEDEPLSTKRPRLTTSDILNVKTDFDCKDSKKTSVLNKFGPEVLIRCHSSRNNPMDSETQVWKAAFEPVLEDKGKITEIVATCGGNIISFIDCSTNSVTKRYKHQNILEDFYVLAWTVLPIGDPVKNSTFLAAAGRLGEIHMINTTHLAAYLSFKAHTKVINTLLFSNDNPAHLFSGGEDGFIYLWDIGIPTLPNFATKHQKLLSLNAGMDVLQLVCSPSPYNLLIAAGDTGLLGFYLSSPYKPQLREPNFVFKLVGSKDRCFYDGLALVSDTLVAVKQSQSSLIHLWDLKENLPSDPKTWSERRRTLMACDIIRSLECSSNVKADYLNLSFQKDNQILMCGDDEGNFWLYDLAKNSTFKLVWPFVENAEEFGLAVDEKKIIVNQLVMSPSGKYLVGCIDKNLVTVWGSQPKTLS